MKFENCGTCAGLERASPFPSPIISSFPFLKDPITSFLFLHSFVLPTHLASLPLSCSLSFPSFRPTGSLSLGDILCNVSSWPCCVELLIFSVFPLPHGFLSSSSQQCHILTLLCFHSNSPTFYMPTSSVTGLKPPMELP